MRGLYKMVYHCCLLSISPELIPGPKVDINTKVEKFTVLQSMIGWGTSWRSWGSRLPVSVNEVLLSKQCFGLLT